MTRAIDAVDEDRIYYGWYTSGSREGWRELLYIYRAGTAWRYVSNDGWSENLIGEI